MRLPILDVLLASGQQRLGLGSPASSNCKDILFEVSGNATNKNLDGITNLALPGFPLGQDIEFLTDFLDKADNEEVEGTETLGGTYCAPTKKNKNNSKIQILFASLTVTRGAWSALGGLGTDYEQYKPDKYSWVQYANSLGYPTLAMDRLAVGKSSRPDPVRLAQAPYEIALYSDLARQIRAGHPELPQKYGHLIWVGNSYGAQLGAGMSGAHPESFDEFILTGFTIFPRKGFVGFSLTNCLPAKVVNPLRWFDLPVGYLATSNKQGRTNSWFGSHDDIEYEEAIAQLFWERQDVVSVGQFASVYAFDYNGGSFTGRIFNLIGEQDQPFCGPGSPVFGYAKCGKQPKDSGVNFPHADYHWKSVDQVGHIVPLHSRARVIFDLAHRWLEGEEFHGGGLA